MSTTRTILIVALLALAGFSLYQKHSRRKQEKQGKGQKEDGGKPNLPESQQDDYEPYSGN